MATGALLLPPGYHPLIDGAVVPSGKLAFYRTGTTTAQNTYTDSTLLTPNSNPVQLNATGGLDTLVYGDGSTGFNYRMRVLSSADAILDTHDDIVVPGAATATLIEGSFTGTLTGMTGATTGTVNYKIVANAAGTGKLCTLYIDATISGTSNTTAMTMTGLPAACAPSVPVRCLCELTDNGQGGLLGLVNISASGTTLSFAIDQPFSSTGFTAANGKGLSAGWQISYPM
jgi:hypothetical protein